MREPADQDQQSYWNANLDPQNLGKSEAPEQFDWSGELTYYFTPDQEYALEQLGWLQGKRVVEIGAGIGTNAIHMAAEGATLVAMDMAHDRLCALRQRYDCLQLKTKPGGQLLLVKATAENLPFRDFAFDAAYCKAVLIHTQLDRSVPEIDRILKPDGVGVFIEPMTRNPLVNLYRRTLAPKIWQSIARYFDEPEFAAFRKTFSRTHIRQFYLVSFLAFAWQFGVRIPSLFRATLAVLNAVDSVLLRVPALAKRSWFAVIVVRK